MNFDEDLRAAEEVYCDASATFSKAIVVWVGRKTRDAFPKAVKLVAKGEYGEEMNFRLRIQRVLDSSGAVLGDIEDPTVEFEDLADLVDPYLDWLSDLNGEDYHAGEHEFDVSTGGDA